MNDRPKEIPPAGEVRHNAVTSGQLDPKQASVPMPEHAVIRGSPQSRKRVTDAYYSRSQRGFKMGGKAPYGDITRYFTEQGILFYGKELIRPTLAQMLRTPVYVQTDLDVYEFFKSQGTMLVNDDADFTGMNGCYLYQDRYVKPDKLHNPYVNVKIATT